MSGRFDGRSSEQAVPALLAVAVAALAVTIWLILPAALFRDGAMDDSGGFADLSIGGSLDLVTQDGGRLRSADLAGGPYAIFFGFTHCPEVCPTTLTDLSDALATLGAEADGLTIYFVSLDPARDTPAALKDYLQSFDRRIVGLTGSEAAVAAAATAYRIYWQKVRTSDGDYTLDHTAVVSLFGPTGRLQAVIGYGEPIAAQVAKLRKLAAGGQRS